MESIPEIPLTATPRSQEAEAVVGFAFAPAPIGSRHKLGGSPDWIQGPLECMCSCGQRMIFYGQLDSIGDRVNLADCGMVYVFVCFSCYETQAILQSY